MRARSPAGFEKTAASGLASLISINEHRRKDMLKSLTNVSCLGPRSGRSPRVLHRETWIRAASGCDRSEMGNFRWLTVGLPGQDVGLALLTIPGPPVFDAETQAKVQEVLAKELPEASSSPPTTCRRATRSSRAAASSSRASLRSSRTASTSASAIRRATRCGLAQLSDVSRTRLSAAGNPRPPARYRGLGGPHSRSPTGSSSRFGRS